MRLNEQKSVLSESTTTAFYAPKSKTNSSRGRGSFNRQRSSQNHQRLACSPNPSPQSNSSPSDNRQKCQICGRFGHTAINCYHRMDHAYEGHVPTKKLAAMVASTIVNKDDQVWYTDSGASNHITSDISSLSIQTEYHGNDQAAVDNDSGKKLFHGKSEHGLYPMQVESSCFSQAIKQVEWRTAMCSEFNALQQCGT
ncbi:hypothetical protein EZV62_016518 [Acer yangbiense]|uniref:CCHC-type domain-containing protein n=1 Tax=Acer yangbiense TaxID=1000413 RepID=A0A5C7HPD1_9ROSI|nr:hypothetical protein EZV62_016518 [Acer yangbiense]